MDLTSINKQTVYSEAAYLQAREEVCFHRDMYEAALDRLIFELSPDQSEVIAGLQVNMESALRAEGRMLRLKEEKEDRDAWWSDWTAQAEARREAQAQIDAFQQEADPVGSKEIVMLNDPPTDQDDDTPELPFSEGLSLQDETSEVDELNADDIQDATDDE